MNIMSMRSERTSLASQKVEANAILARLLFEIDFGCVGYYAPCRAALPLGGVSYRIDAEFEVVDGAVGAEIEKVVWREKSLIVPDELHELYPYGLAIRVLRCGVSALERQTNFYAVYQNGRRLQ